MKKPSRFQVFKLRDTQLWIVEITKGYGGNYEYENFHFGTWRNAFDWAYKEAKKWRCQCW